MPMDDFKGFSTQYNEQIIQNPVVEGDIPEWLLGDFISNGPAQFEIGSMHFNHWLDGLAMLKKFSFKSGQVQFQNRFLRSKQYTQSHTLQRLSTNEFATYASSSVWGRIKNTIQDALRGSVYDNCNVNILKMASHYIAMTESNHVIEFNPLDLTTIGAFSYSDKMAWQLGTAHPKTDTTTGEIINVAIHIGRQIKYHIYKINTHSTQREIIQTYLSDRLFYMHSFSTTHNYVVLFKSPLTVNKFKLLLGLPFNNTLFLKENTPSYFVVIDRRDGTIHEIETSPFVCLHSANAYENKKELILDLICYEAINPYLNLYLSNLQKDQPSLAAGALKRYVIHPHLKHCNETTLTPSKHEFPSIHHILNGKNYNFLYCNSLEGQDIKFLNSIQKIHVQTGTVQIWKKEHYYPGEAIFVARNNAKSEDDGVLLSIVYDAAIQCSLLVIIDAVTMQEVAEISLPFYLPFGLHGNFYRRN
jgi:beta,beta-carotene 9',10'-dioxygenase